jgi:hypothetical protein
MTNSTKLNTTFGWLPDWAFPVCVALVACAPALWKPLTIDDAAYVQYARQIRECPAQPYAFTIFWEEAPQPAHEVLAPALVPYWWALGMWVLGESEFLWHLWFVPFAILAAWALDRLCVRFSVPRRLAVVIFLWSPLFLPQVNFMLDIPALALALAGMAVLTDDSISRRAGWAIAAGLLMGGALLAKYSTLGVLGGGLAYAVLGRRWNLLKSLATAVVLVATWEIWLAASTGQSHWWWHWTQAASDRGHLSGKTVRHAWESLVFLGGGLPLVGLIGLCGRRNARPFAVGAAAIGVLGAGLTCLFASDLRLSELLFAAAGYTLLAAAIGCLFTRIHTLSRDDLLLMSWLAFELVNAVLPVPFMAMRRCLGPAVPALLLVLRQTALAGDVMRRLRGRVIAGLVTAGCLLGFAVAWADLSFACAQREAITVLKQELGLPGARVWICGHWGWQYYGEAAGMRSVDPGQLEFQPGDLLVAAENVDSQTLPRVVWESLELVQRYESTDLLPVRNQNWLAGTSYHAAPGVPYTLSRAPHLEFMVWRVRHGPSLALIRYETQ